MTCSSRPSTSTCRPISSLRSRALAERRACSWSIAPASWREASIADLPSLLSPGDLVVANDTRVFPARLLGRRDPSGGAVECLLLEPAGRQA